GSEIALEEAGPVAPVFVAEDWAVEAPEPPEVAVGSMLALMLPPAPPLASVLAMESPPVMRMAPVSANWPDALTVAAGEPPAPAMAAAAPPPLPPVPPVRRAVVRLAASPVSPESELALDWAPGSAEQTS